MKDYPNIDRILKAKEDQRRALAELSFEEKIELDFRLAERRKFVESGRDAEKQAPSPNSGNE
jgi:hypothetical protein